MTFLFVNARPLVTGPVSQSPAVKPTLPMGVITSYVIVVGAQSPCGPLVGDILPQDTTMTATYYVQNVLYQVISANNEQRPKVSTSRTLPLHDNAGLHKARDTTQSLREL
ncbi:transposase [Elysia marginata]|uniref:Transposase n=1 Tax=Elysia marginata TaxID=1093978 RepID=A0AAV4H5F1_9GAST|nr:transposase [Elysia marginata]